jgi:hypothetical protein
VEENFFMVGRDKRRNIPDRDKRGDQPLCCRRGRRGKVRRLAHLARGFRLPLRVRVKRDSGEEQKGQQRQSEGQDPH